MGKIFTISVPNPKSRKVWSIKPFERIAESKKTYNRKRDKIQWKNNY